MDNKEIQKILKDRGLSITENRVAILQCLDDGHHFHSVSEILKHIDNINTKSIYNNIKTLINAGVVDSFSFGGVSKYALNDNLEEGNTEIHVINQGSEVSHIPVSKDVFNKINLEVSKHGKKVKSIKIFVYID